MWIAMSVELAWSLVIYDACSNLYDLCRKSREKGNEMWAVLGKFSAVVELGLDH